MNIPTHRFRNAAVGASSARMPLTQEEIDGCRDAFLAFDKDRSGTIDVWELRAVLEGEHLDFPVNCALTELHLSCLL